MPRDVTFHLPGDDLEDSRPREARADQRVPLTAFERQRAEEVERYCARLASEERDHADTKSDLALERRLVRSLTDRIADAVACLTEGRADAALYALTSDEEREAA